MHYARVSNRDRDVDLLPSQGNLLLFAVLKHRCPEKGSELGTLGAGVNAALSCVALGGGRLEERVYAFHVNLQASCSLPRCGFAAACAPLQQRAAAASASATTAAGEESWGC